MNETARLNPGALVDGLQIEHCLAHSDRAITYLVSDPALGTRFVLKECWPAACAQRAVDGTISPSNAQQQGAFRTALAAFRAACRLAASLEHPNITRVLRLFEAQGTAYCLMAWEPGQTLQERLQQQGALQPEAVRRVMLGLMQALRHLHERSVFHLALDPSHVYLTERGEPLLLDFHRAAEHQSEQMSHDMSGHYAAPEQVGGNAAPGPYTDIYRLAAVLYHSVTGQAPACAADRSETIATGGADPLATVAEQISDRSLGGLGDTIDYGLRLAPRDRPASIEIWERSFASVDWRRQVGSSHADPELSSERREWLAPMLVGGLVAVLLVAALYLAISDAPDASPQTPASASAESAPAVIPAEETERWQAALRADTVLGYRRFLAAYPDTVYRSQAEVQLDILDERRWQELAAEDSRPAYEDYLALFPNGLHQTEALRRIEAIDEAAASAERERLERERNDEAAWQQAIAARSVTSMDDYLSAWPAGRYVEEAQQLRRSLRNRDLETRAWESARKLNTSAAYQAYLDAYPEGEHSAEALITLEHLDLSPGKAFRDCSGCPPMMVIPAGEFWQGSAEDSPLAANNEKPRRVVNIPRPIAVGVHEVTFSEWDACHADGGCDLRPADNGWGRGNRPVIMVSWNDAQNYVGWLSEKTGLNYRLPSESEWEYFARAGESGDFLGGSPEQLCRFANIAGSETGFRWQSEACSDGHALGTTPAGSLAPNAFGLHDVIGNVAEWTDDCMNLSYLDAPSDGSAWGRGICSSHMTRGGSWVTGERETRLPARFNLDNGDRNDFTGFRVVRGIEE